MALDNKERILDSLKNGSEPGSIHPLLLDLELKCVIPNELHLLLKITDKLIENLINAAVANDSPHSKPLKGDMVKLLIHHIWSCGISFTISDNKSRQHYEFTSLTIK